MTPNEFYYIREHLEMTQKELAKTLEISTSSVRNYENGRTKIPLSIEYIMNKRDAIYDFIQYKGTR